MFKAIAFDNRLVRKVLLSDAARPYVALKPEGYTFRVIGRYSTMKSAKEAAKRFNDLIDRDYTN